jgi:hypothetical protein
MIASLRKTYYPANLPMIGAIAPQFFSDDGVVYGGLFSVFLVRGSGADNVL